MMRRNIELEARLIDDLLDLTRITHGKLVLTGIGIPPEKLAYLFLPFEQAGRANDHRFGGLGLGLAISKALVEMHGGTISVESAGQDQGTTFRVSLPL